MDDVLPEIPFVQAEFYTPTDWRRIDYVVAHDMEYPEVLTATEDCAAYFAHPRLPDGRPNRASAHICGDADSLIRCVHDRDVAYAAPRINNDGLHIEHAGYARQTREDWLDEFSLAMLHQTAVIAAAWCVAYAIPVVYVDPEGLRNGERGITTHVASTIAFGIVGGHTDPGENFPMDVWLELIAANITPPTPPEPIPSVPLGHRWFAALEA